MKVVLLEDVDKLGYAGDIKTVKDGYAKNYLIPKGFALAATKSNLKLVEEKRKAILRRIEKRIEQANKVKEALDGLEIEIKARAGEKGKLFGSVTANEIYEQLKDKAEFDKKSIRLPKDGIKEIGKHEVEVAIYRDVKATVKVNVVPLNEE
ncbi:50S ribosomal protein L9 [Hippea maritima]|uniref:Large ribosomal subunit protein bL9 n=1 Tax=Hippea maritima (strain ATCC 700847 / DSM 10411 / MH2) TaxID=760142 RepID=F2LU73_HIPMA|nr:50S ribosomal protein L9 [Hippea maritima]AEA34536.1 50S ribosomal protein L9 [Hippea maritima DSM 10411]